MVSHWTPKTPNFAFLKAKTMAILVFFYVLYILNIFSDIYYMVAKN